MCKPKAIYLLPLITFLNGYVCFAQQDLTRLQRQLQTQIPDSTRVYTYLEVGKHYAKSDLDSAVLYVNKGLSLAEKIAFQPGRVKCLIQLGIIKKNNGNYNEAIAYYNSALPLAKQLKMIPSVAAIYNNLGNTYQKFGILDSAMLYLQKGLEIKLQQGDKEGIINSCINLGNFYSTRRQYKDAKAFYALGLRTEHDINTPLQRAKLLTNLGNVFYETGQTDSARYFYEHALKIQAKDNIADDLRFVYLNLGNIHLQNGDHKTALSFYNKSLSINKRAGDVFKTINALNSIGNVYRQQQQYDKALSFYQDALKEAERINSLDQVKQLLFNISSCHEKLHQTATALLYHKKAKQVADSLYNTQKASILAEMQVKFDTEQKGKELLQQKAINEKKIYERNAFILASALLLIMLVMAIWIYLRTRFTNRKLAMQKAIIEKREREKGILLRELHHRTKNNLQLVSSLLNLQAYQLKDTAAAHAVKEGQARVEAMALIHRDLYQKENITRVNLKTYLENMVGNLISTYNFSRSSLTITLDIQALELEADLAIPLGLIANELISNTFKHAFTDQEHPKLFITAKEQATHELQLIVADNGKGLEQTSLSDTTFGMNMIHSLVKQLQGSIAMETHQGCVTTLVVPLKKETLVEAGSL